MFFRVYTLKLPEKLIPSIAAEPNPREFQHKKNHPYFYVGRNIWEFSVCDISLEEVRVRMHEKKGGGE